VVHEIIDASLVAHVGTVRDGCPVVIPMFCARDGESLLLHGAPAAGVIQRAQRGLDICAEMTLIDGLVLARSAFHHSVNYRSVVVVGQAVPLDGPAKERALELFVERLAPGRQAQLRSTTTKEHQGTAVLTVSLEQASAKVRTGPPIDDDEDYDHPVWAGVVPVLTTFGSPIPDPRLGEGIAPADNVTRLAGQVL
jgi:nitroimidazol reductase NimA-like FMN-containing flavoprotein (pyridoxamine 5'-phosphate oxidase superfamily)